MSYVLKYTNQNREVFYFKNHGAPWPNNPERLLLNTTAEPKEAAEFDSHDAAITALAVSNTALAGTEQLGWEVITRE